MCLRNIPTTIGNEYWMEYFIKLRQFTYTGREINLPWGKKTQEQKINSVKKKIY